MGEVEWGIKVGQVVWVETVGSQLASHGTEEKLLDPGVGWLERLVASICVLTSMKYVGSEFRHLVSRLAPDLD